MFVVRSHLGRPEFNLRAIKQVRRRLLLQQQYCLSIQLLQR